MEALFDLDVLWSHCLRLIEWETAMASDGIKYYEDYILRKEGRSKWIQYWVVIRGVWMLFYQDEATHNRDNFKGSIELSSGTKCNIAKRSSYSFPFYLSTARGTHLFKCETNLKRHQWMFLIELAAKGSPPVPAPHALPKSPQQNSGSETRSDNSDSETPDSEPDEDNLSTPAGVILVTAAVENLSHNDQTPCTNCASSVDRSLINRAVLSTGIGGATVMQDSRSSPAKPKCDAETPTTKPGLSSHSRRADLTPHWTSSNGLSPHSALEWNRGCPERPSSSPSLTQRRFFDSRLLTHKMTPVTSSQEKVRFSRHMTKSAPDIQILSLEDNP